MSVMNQLNNAGIVYIGDENALQQSHKTFVVVGIARGGTSMLAGSLHHLGVFMGSVAKAPIFEDIYLSKPMEGGNDDRVKEIVEEYNVNHKIWGFKRPSIIHHLERIHLIDLKNPIYLFVFKDILAIANRNSISMDTDLINGIKAAHHHYGKVLQFITNNQLNGYLFSFEKIMRSKEMFVDTLVDIIGKDNVNEQQKANAINFIDPNPHDYLNVSRLNRGKGSVDRVSSKFVSGWARYMTDERVAKVDLYVNDNKVATTEANQFREDLLDRKVHSTGSCAYVFLLEKDDIAIKNGDKVNVKISDEIFFLREEPRLFTAVE